MVLVMPLQGNFSCKCLVTLWALVPAGELVEHAKDVCKKHVSRPREKEIQALSVLSESASLLVIKGTTGRPTRFWLTDEGQ